MFGQLDPQRDARAGQTGGMSRYQDDPTRGKSATVRPFAKPALKRPEDDPVIAMARDRHKKGLQIEKQRQAMSGASGAVLHKILELKALEADLRSINEGVQEYQDQVGSPPRLTLAGCPHPRRYPRNGPCPLAAKPPATRTSHTPHTPHAPLLQVDLMNDRKRDLAKIVKVEQAWCDNFNKLIGPFEEKYEESKAHKDGQSGPLAVPQLGSWRLLSARLAGVGTPRVRPRHRARSHRFACVSRATSKAAHRTAFDRAGGGQGLLRLRKGQVQGEPPAAHR